MIRQRVYALVLLMVLYGSSAISAEVEFLQTKDINRIMQQIFQQHVDEKEMTTSILKKSFKVFLDQFDPERVYLLEEEASSFFNIDDNAMKRLLEQYQQGQFNEFLALNDLAQKAIWRARQLRKDLESQSQSLIAEASSYAANGLEEWQDADLQRPFAKNSDQLKENNKHKILKFLAQQRRRYGKAYLDARLDSLLSSFENEMHAHENPYLFVNNKGLPMNAVERQNAFVMHVLKALSNSLDAHTSILNPSEALDLRMRLEKEVQGVGILVEKGAQGQYLISQILPNSPAEKSGRLQLNDQLVSIDGVALSDKSMEDVLALMGGQVGSKAALVVKRSLPQQPQYQQELPVVLERAQINVDEDRAQSSFEIFGTGIIGKIKLDSFYQSDNGVSSESDVRAAIKQLDSQGNLRGLILDFRENGGGFLSQAVKVAGLFITNGIVVISKYFNGEEHFYRDMDGKVAYDGPLIILTSKATASAAEIVAQALQDYGVALVVGDEHTYGKGTIQSQTVTGQHGEGAAYFKVTVGKYYTVSGKTPQIQGVRADIVTPSQFQYETIGEKYLDYPLQQDTIASSYDDPLEDVVPSLKGWYMRYYTPSLQQRKMIWRDMLPTLKSNSSYRLAHNKNYQAFMKSSNVEMAAKIWKKEQSYGHDDLQMAEAINIIKDMVLIQSQQRSLPEASNKAPKNEVSTPAAKVHQKVMPLNVK